MVTLRYRSKYNAKAAANSLIEKLVPMSMDG